jgi:endoglucanase
VALVISLSGATYARDKGKWGACKPVLLSKGGRIVDFHQDNCSQSEGQGYGLLLAVAFGGPEAFDKWKLGKRREGRWETISHNNATGGDSLIAIATLKILSEASFAALSDSVVDWKQ